MPIPNIRNGRPDLPIGLQLVIRKGKHIRAVFQSAEQYVFTLGLKTMENFSGNTERYHAYGMRQSGRNGHGGECGAPEGGTGCLGQPLLFWIFSIS